MTSVSSTPGYPVSAMSDLDLTSEDTYELPLGDVENYSTDQKEILQGLKE